jgi:ATP-binding cassette subfamily B protein
MFLFRWLWKNLQGYKGRYIIAMIMAFAAQIMLIFNPLIMRAVVDTFISSENAAQNLANQRSLLFLLIGATVGVNLVRTGMQYSCQMILEVCSQGAVYKIRSHLFRNMQAQDADFYDTYRTGDIMTRLSGDVEMLRHTTAWTFRTLFENIVCFLAVSIFYFTINPYMALCMISITPLVFIISMFMNKKMGPLFGEQRERSTELNTAGEENISGNRVVRAFANEDYEIERFRSYNQRNAAQAKKTSVTWWRFFLPMEITSQAVFAVHLIAGGFFAISGQISMGDYMAFSMLAWAVSMPMSMMGHVINDIKRFSASANKIIEVYYSRSKIVDRTDALDLPGRIKGEIEFKNVSYGYGKRQILQDISLKIGSGETVAIMGATGSGKTTLINLIPRIYDVNQGEILIDGVNIRRLRLKQLRSAIGMATQEVLLFSDTIDANIAFGNSQLDEDGVKAYAKIADAHEFIEKTSLGYDTIVGERGVGLSGGQKQRVALARALAVRPSIMILDDTTSAVDSETEAHIQESLRNLDFDCTKIIIAARISSAKDADKIIVLQDGRIAESGTHEELIAKNGYYREVYELQS